MRKLVVNQFLTLDGVMEAPEKWNSQYLNDEELVKDILADFSASGSFLFGRTTWQFLAACWPTRTGDMADKFNNHPKHVVSATLQKAEWNNSAIINGNVVEEIKKIKEQSGKNILVLGSYELVQTLMRENLVDEYKLYIYPLTLGTGKRLFEEGTIRQTLKLINTQVFSNGAIALVYQPEKIFKQFKT
jgi:dihydrofolate reductase